MIRKEITNHRMTAILCTAGIAAVLAVSPVLAQEAGSGPVDARTAEQIAFTDAGVEETVVDRLHTVQDREDRERVYEVEFIYQDYEYDYTIRESDGVILEWKVEGWDVGAASAELSLNAADGNTDAAQPAGEATDPSQVDGAASQGFGAVLTGDGVTVVGFESAKETVLADCGAADSATITSIHFENGGRYYEHEFELHAGRAEFEYTVDAESGEIVHSEMDD